VRERESVNSKKTSHESYVCPQWVHDNESCMGWLRWVGSLKLQVSFVKEPYERDDILPKRPISLKSLLIIATPYHECKHCWGDTLPTHDCTTMDMSNLHSFFSHICTSNIYMTDIGWLRLVGSLKLLVSLAEYRLFYRSLLQKRPVISRSLLLEATP